MRTRYSTFWRARLGQVSLGLTPCAPWQPAHLAATFAPDEALATCAATATIFGAWALWHKVHGSPSEWAATWICGCVRGLPVSAAWQALQSLCVSAGIGSFPLAGCPRAGPWQISQLTDLCDCPDHWA